MKKQTNIFAIITVVLAGLGMIANLVEMLIKLLSKRGFAFGYRLNSSEIVTIVVIIILLVAIPDLIRRAIQIVFGLLTRNPKPEDKTVLNWLCIALVVAIPIIDTLINLVLPNFLMRTLRFDSMIYSAYNVARSGAFAGLCNSLANTALILASAFAISEKKLGYKDNYVED